MIRVHACLPLAVPVVAAWAVIARFDSLAEWHPGVVASPADGAVVGAVRTVVLPDGTRLTERLTDWAADACRYRYILTDGPMPVRDYSAEMAVVECGPARCRLEWRATFDPIRNEDGEVLAATMGEVFSLGLTGVANCLERFHET